MDENFDVIVIGAGLSGLAASLRFAMFGKKVCCLEQHSIPGGLNSYYRRGARKLDVGLHAMTNFTDRKQRSSPMGKLFKQLRLSRDLLDIVEQSHSKTVFASEQIAFNNDQDLIFSEVKRAFPGEEEGFGRLWRAVDEVDYSDLSAPWSSARAFVQSFIREPQLEDMLFCPLLFYGSAWEHDMDLQQFAILFRSIYMEGFCRPKEGIRPLLKWLTEQVQNKGGDLRFRCGVERIVHKEGKVLGVETSKGTFIASPLVLSSMGHPETLRACGASREDVRPGSLGYLESIIHYPSQPKDWGIDESIIFWNRTDRFSYKNPERLMDDHSAVLCFPNNFQDMNLEEGVCRVTRLASYEHWKALTRKEVLAKKANDVEASARALLAQLCQSEPGEPSFKDTFTPLTVEKFTKHAAGAVYGSPDKLRDGKTSLDGLHLIGTDQGYLGIVGSMLSGISMANQHLI